MGTGFGEVLQIVNKNVEWNWQDLQNVASVLPDIRVLDGASVHFYSEDASGVSFRDDFDNAVDKSAVADAFYADYCEDAEEDSFDLDLIKGLKIKSLRVTSDGLELDHVVQKLHDLTDELESRCFLDKLGTPNIYFHSTIFGRAVEYGPITRWGDVLRPLENLHTLKIVDSSYVPCVSIFANALPPNLTILQVIKTNAPQQGPYFVIDAGSAVAPKANRKLQKLMLCGVHFEFSNLRFFPELRNIWLSEVDCTRHMDFTSFHHLEELTLEDMHLKHPLLPQTLKTLSLVNVCGPGCLHLPDLLEHLHLLCVGLCHTVHANPRLRTLCLEMVPQLRTVSFGLCSELERMELNKLGNEGVLNLVSDSKDFNLPGVATCRRHGWWFRNIKWEQSAADTWAVY